MSLSPKVDRAARKSEKAADSIRKLELSVQNQAKTQRDDFFSQINEALGRMGITDAEEFTYDIQVKTEYSSEISLDKIANAVTAALKAVAAQADPTDPAPAMSPDAIEAYSGLVAAIAEAAKSGSRTAGSLTFSSTRLSPGFLAFLYSSSQSLTDEAMFGKETVTSTAVFHRIMRSKEDIVKTAEFESVLFEYYNVKTWQTILKIYLEDFKARRIDAKTWREADATGRAELTRAQNRLRAAGHDPSGRMLMTAMPAAAPAADPLDAVAAEAMAELPALLDSLEAEGGEAAEVARTARERMAAEES